MSRVVVRNFSFAARMVPVTPLHVVRDFSPAVKLKLLISLLGEAKASRYMFSPWGR